MPDPARGRWLVLASLLTILALSVGLSVAAGSSSSPVVRYGRPLAVALGCLLVWQGRLWARWLLVLLGLGVLLAGPIALGNEVPPWSLGGALSWLASILYAASLFVLLASRHAIAYITSDAGTGARPSPKAGT